MKIIGLDVGEKRIGVARADSSTRIAVPVGFIDVDGSEYQEIARLMRLNSTNFVVLGLPRSNEGNETAQSAYVRSFAKVLIEKIPEAKVRFQDESLTSVVAEDRLKSRKKPYEKGDIDAEAASIILQDFIEGFKTDATSSSDEPPEQHVPEADDVGLGASIENRIAAGSEQLQNLAKKEGDKVKLQAKKTKHKMSTLAKSISIVTVLVIVGILVTGGLLIYKHYQDEERARYWAEQEALLNENSTFQFTIRPGETIYEIKDSLVEIGYDASAVDKAFNAKYNFGFLQGRPEGATLEGYLFGETHEFYKTDSVETILTKYLEGMEEVIRNNDLEKKYADRGLSLYEGITLASIVQSETGALTDEMPTVAQVFYSRMAYGIPLGSDVTVSYALDTIDPDRQTYADNQAALEINSCYNTRKNPGLPCGPISNPGLSALLAVAQPSDTAYLYFLTGDDGLMYYSYTEAEHNQNAYAHCQNLCNISL